MSAPFYRAVLFAVLASLLIWLGACKGDLTEIVVVVDSDLVVPQELDRVTIQVDGLGDQPDVVTNLRERALPIWLGLVNEGDALGPITVRVIGAFGTETRVMAERSAVRFERGKTLTLRIELLRACTTDASACAQACDNAECLTAWNGPPPKLDASIPDTGMGVPDAGEDAADDDSGVIDAGDAGDDASDASDASDAMIDAGRVCVIDAGTCFDYTPSNFDPLAVLDTASANGALTVDCPGAEFDSTALSFTGWCGDDAPAVVEVVQPDGIAAVVIPATSLTITGGGSLRLVGNRPVIFAVFGDVEINGSLDASAVGAVPGAGGNAACTVGTGAAGVTQTATDRGGSGGGGGAFGSVGGTGGRGDRGTTTAAGMLEGNASMVPLRGGCAGGRGGMGTSTDGGNVGGGGGGAVQISVSGTLNVGGLIAAGGGGGQRGMRNQDGGGGGGSGGAILLECQSAEFTAGAWVSVNGGGGGGASDYDSSTSQPGLDAPAATFLGGNGGAGDNRGGDGGRGAGRDAASTNGQDGAMGSIFPPFPPYGAGGGGGGGGLGRIRVRDNTRPVSACTLSGNFSPAPSIECGG